MLDLTRGAEEWFTFHFKASMKYILYLRGGRSPHEDLAVPSVSSRAQLTQKLQLCVHSTRSQGTRVLRAKPQVTPLSPQKKVCTLVSNSGVFKVLFVFQLLNHHHLGPHYLTFLQSNLSSLVKELHGTSFLPFNWGQ